MERRALYLFLVSTVVGCRAGDRVGVTDGSSAAAVDDAVLVDAEARPADWLTTGRTYSEQRFSPLDLINQDNAGELGLAWVFDTGTDRGLEATPIVVDGILYTTGSWSLVYAIDARTGKLLWKWDPQVSPEYNARACCEPVNRGVAVYRGKVYVGVLDGIWADSGMLSFVDKLDEDEVMAIRAYVIAERNKIASKQN